MRRIARVLLLAAVTTLLALAVSVAVVAADTSGPGV
jgi:hypothetical protein